MLTISFILRLVIGIFSCENMSETVSTRKSLGIEKIEHLQNECSVFSASRLQMHKLEGVSTKL